MTGWAKVRAVATDANEMHETVNKGTEIMVNEMVLYNADWKMLERSSCMPSLIQIHDALTSCLIQDLRDSDAGLW